MELLASLFLFALGALLASFIGVISERAYTGDSWLSGRSRCNSCAHFLSARDLVPLMSWLLVQGRCRYCGSRLPVGYLVTEALLGLLFVLSYHMLGPGVPILLFLASLCVLTFIVLYDLRHTVVPPTASLLLVVLALLYALSQGGGSTGIGLTLLTAGLLSLFIFLLHALSRGRAMGLGDTPITFALSLIVGHSLAFPGLLFSFWIGALFGLVVLLRRPGGPTMGIEVPFVPFLAVGFLLAFFTKWNPLPLVLF